VATKHVYYILIVGGHIVKSLTKSSELRDEEPLDIKNDRLNALEVHSFILSENAKF